MFENKKKYPNKKNSHLLTNISDRCCTVDVMTGNFELNSRQIGNPCAIRQKSQG